MIALALPSLYYDEAALPPLATSLYTGVKQAVPYRTGREAWQEFLVLLCANFTRAKYGLRRR